jgi:hypothetical protein
MVVCVVPYAEIISPADIKATTPGPNNRAAASLATDDDSATLATSIGVSTLGVFDLTANRRNDCPAVVTPKCTKHGGTETADA